MNMKYGMNKHIGDLYVIKNKENMYNFFSVSFLSTNINTMI